MNQADQRQDQLAHDIAQALDDSGNVQKYAICCRKYQPTAIQKALRTAKGIPSERIKKSRAAVFFYFVKRYAHNTS